MTVAAASPKSFDFGGVFSNTFSVMGKNFITFAVLGIFAEIPSALYVWFAIGSNPFAGFRYVPTTGVQPMTYAGLIALNGLLSLVFTFVLQAALIYGTVATLNGRRASIGDCLRTGLGAFFPVVAIGLLAGMGIVLGLILLIVPGVILLVGWSVAIPVRIVEKKPIFEVFGRSWNLTSGHRWMIFAIYIVVSMGNFGLTFAIAPLAALSAGGTSFAGASILYVIASAAIRILISIFGATLAGVIYFELRSIKEGMGAEELASVFD